MANVIREDVVQIGFDIDNNALTKLDKQISSVAKSLTGNMPDGAFAELAEGADDASKNVKKIGDSLKNIGKATGLSKVAEHLNNTDTKAGKAYAALKKVASVAYDKTVAGLKKIGSALGTITKKAAKYAAVGVGAAATGVGAIVAQSVKSYADYEQLVGGVDTLFKDSSATVQKYANDAYKTAGLSANTYMETATSFSASLLQSLGGDTAKAADYANTAITDMSDNANKMGTSMDSLIQTYQSLSRGNFAMLDNLKLGKIHYCSV